MKIEVGALSLFTREEADSRLISESLVWHTNNTPAGIGKDNSRDLCLLSAL